MKTTAPAADWREQLQTPGKHSATLKAGEHCGENVWILPNGDKLARYPNPGFFTPDQAAQYFKRQAS